jgi:hypothetical protein
MREKFKENRPKIAGIAAGLADAGVALDLAGPLVNSLSSGIIALSPAHAGIGVVLLVVRAVATFLIGWFARDNKVTSKQLGLDKERDSTS